MDENENINVNITLPGLTAADINGIVTAGSDGTYNITYTNLTAGQIQAIGQAFENAMENNLHEVAFSGAYEDIDGVPTNVSDFINDEGFLTEYTETDPVFIASPAHAITSTDIVNWNNKSDFSGDYEDLNGAPQLPIDDGSNENGIYTTIDEGTENEKRVIAPLQKIAFTNNYIDLNNRFFSINFGHFIYRYHENNWTIFNPNDNNTSSDYDFMHGCGFYVGFIKDISELYDSNTENKISLVNKILTLYNNFQTGQICYLQKDTFSYYLITEMIANYNNNNLNGLTIYCTFTNRSNYFSDIINNSFSTNEDIQNNLNAIQVSSTNIIIIIDFEHDILYSLPRVIAPVAANNKSVYVDWKNNTFNVNISSKAGNKLELITNAGEEGLYVN